MSEPEVSCPHCLETRLVEKLQQPAKRPGHWFIFCSVCGLISLWKPDTDAQPQA